MKSFFIIFSLACSTIANAAPGASFQCSLQKMVTDPNDSSFMRFHSSDIKTWRLPTGTGTTSSVAEMIPSEGLLVTINIVPGTNEVLNGTATMKIAGVTAISTVSHAQTLSVQMILPNTIQYSLDCR